MVTDASLLIPNLPSFRLLSRPPRSLTEQSEQYVRTRIVLPLCLLILLSCCYTLFLDLSCCCCCSTAIATRPKRSRCQNTWLWTAKIYGPSGLCHPDQLGRRWGRTQANTESRPHFAGSSILTKKKKNVGGWLNLYVFMLFASFFFRRSADWYWCWNGGVRTSPKMVPAKGHKNQTSGSEGHRRES